VSDQAKGEPQEQSHDDEGRNLAASASSATSKDPPSSPVASSTFPMPPVNSVDFARSSAVAL
jgi:hypothetical protein